jgi:DNA-binding transcriptional LysR family regulator
MDHVSFIDDRQAVDTLVSMRVFRAVVEQQSFVRAAARMQISPAMASKHVLHLERHLDARLLNRSSRHLSLTEAGRVYFDQCRDLLDTLAEAEASVGRTAVIPRGVLKLSAPVWFANRIFSRVLADYRIACPEVTFDIDLSGRMVNLVEEGFDLALRVSHALRENLIARPIGPIRFRLVASPDYVGRAGRPAQPSDLAEHAMLGYSLLAAPSGLTLEGPNGQESVTFSSVLQTNNEGLMHAAALDGMGLALLPSWLIDDDLTAGRLESVLPDCHVAAGTLYAVYTSRRYLSSKVRTFIDFIAQDGRLA